MRAQPENHDTLSDIDLATLAAKRDGGAIKLIVVRNNQRLFRTAWSVLRHHNDAEEVVQEAYLKAFASIATYSGKSSLSTWLTRITLNAALDFRRASERRRAAFEAQDISMIEDQMAVRRTNESPAQAPEIQLGRLELARTLKAAIARLPDPYRSVFVLRDVEGMSARETAEVTTLNEATVKTRLFRARQLLRQDLEPDLQALLAEVVTFAGADCNAMTRNVLKAMGLDQA